MAQRPMNLLDNPNENDWFSQNDPNGDQSPVGWGGAPVAGGVAGQQPAPYAWNPNEPKPGDPGYPVTGFSEQPFDEGGIGIVQGGGDGNDGSPSLQRGGGYFTNDQKPVFDPTTGTWSVPGGPSGLTIGQLAAGGQANAGFPGQFTAPQRTAPAAFSFGDFKAPSVGDALNDPGYQFRVDQGIGVLDRSAAGKGLLGSSGTLQNLVDYGQNAASQEYQNVWNRDYTAWGGNRQNALDTFTTARQGDDTNYGNAYQKWLQDYNIFTGTQDRNFDKQFRYAQA